MEMSRSRKASITFNQLKRLVRENVSMDARFVVDNGVLIKYRGDTEDWIDLVIPDGVEAIGDGVFDGFGAIRSIKIPPSVKRIGNEAFRFTLMENFLVPNTVEELGKGVFYGCDRLTEVVLGKGLDIVPDETFFGCNELQTVIVREGTTGIGDFAFFRCYKLKCVKLPKTLMSIGKSAFVGCQSLEKIEIPDSVMELGKNAFSFCKKLADVKMSWQLFEEFVRDDPDYAFDHTPFIRDKRNWLRNNYIN